MPMPPFTSMRPEELDALRELSRHKIVLELGAFVGGSTVVMAETATLVFSVDWHKGDPHAGEADTLQEYLENIRHVREKVIPIIGRFEDVLPMLRSRKFDLILIDGYHTVDAVTHDLSHALRLVAPRGVIALHDYGLFEVKEACDRLGVTPSRVIHTLAIVERKPWKRNGTSR